MEESVKFRVDRLDFVSEKQLKWRRRYVFAETPCCGFTELVCMRK